MIGAGATEGNYKRVPNSGKRLKTFKNAAFLHEKVFLRIVPGRRDETYSRISSCTAHAPKISEGPATPTGARPSCSFRYYDRLIG